MQTTQHENSYYTTTTSVPGMRSTYAKPWNVASFGSIPLGVQTGAFQRGGRALLLFTAPKAEKICIENHCVVCQVLLTWFAL